MPAGDLKLIGGWLCLDFANTAERLEGGRFREFLGGYFDLVSWGQHAGVLTEAEALQCLKEARQHPTEAEAVLKRAIVLREAVYRIFSAIAGNHPSSASDIAALNTELSRAMTRMQITPADGGYSWTYATEENALDRVLWPVVRSAADLLTSDKLNRIDRCPGKNCGWLFLDMSRNRSRRWCDMKDCGNRAKARRHYQRRRRSIKSRS